MLGMVLDMLKTPWIELVTLLESFAKTPVGLMRSVLAGVFGKSKRKSMHKESRALIVHERFRWQLRTKPVHPPKPTLPDDLVPNVLDFLGAADLCTAASINTLWFFHAYADRRWARLCVKDFSVEPTSVSGYQSKHIAARTLYKSILDYRHSHFGGAGIDVSALPTLPVVSDF
ncbi:Hypothetical Protein FCC1311_093642 [Hondaea fermentalgiana]|uniref:F-box domain-containing protein n=1 Tax=Hondaea fermentalgiana TaxID=2315210 RepID=A0A2R5GQL4_9STRA|nr:Hypothetical Protein FCC1311_093642 [Hondaea fermentalgiana]|eukprot:GBG33140.1 Hypothetical Protein FCC1311_093642 [Hondaea fermentalgiana]